MLEKAKSGEQIRVVADQYGSPTYAPDLANIIRSILEKKIPFGLYHATNSGSCSWYEFTQKIFALCGIAVPVTPMTTAESGTKVRRPQYSILKNTRLPELGIPPLRSWEEALADYIQHEIKN